MKRTRRYIFNTLTALNLLLLLGVVGFWVRSYWKFTDVQRQSWAITEQTEIEPTGRQWHYMQYRVISVRGTIGLFYQWMALPPPIPELPYPPEWSLSMREVSDDPGDWFAFFDSPTMMNRLGFGYVNFVPGSEDLWPLLILPHWFLTLIFATLPAIWLFKWNKRRKLSPNTCPACGYDLTGNESGVCPECGGGTVEST